MDVLIVGGGLAGLAAATALAPLEQRVTILEARPRLGGRASSFTDPATGQLVDACQHVNMGCCTNFKQFAETIGVAKFLQPQETLNFVTPDRRVSRFRRNPWPAPFHLGRAFAGLHFLSAGEKLRIAWGLLQMRREPWDFDPPLRPWLEAEWQTTRCIERFWNVVLTSALNANVNEVGLKYARKVFVDAFLTDRDGFVVEVPTVPLGRLYGEELRGWLAKHGVTVMENCAARRLVVPNTIELRDGRRLTASNVLLAVPFERVLDLLPESLAADPFFARIRRLEPSPITSVHLWYDREVFPIPHAVLVDCLGQWVFRRENGYLQVVVSAAAALKALGREEIERRIVEELHRLFPQLRIAKLLRSKVVTEQNATFRAVPGVDAFRPSQRTPVPGLFLAGDWTDTGWPATMEGAVRSGHLAAYSIFVD
jgi:squalene-associated FAD-dependent desaturase